MESKPQTDDLVMTLVDLALTRPEAEHEAYLRSACGSNSDLFNQAWNYVQWEKRMKGFLLSPLHPPSECEESFKPGQLLINRFRLLRELAQGGMGIVWEAIDEKLERRVALKCAKAKFRSHLPPEVRNAREISHPNVCKIFEIHTASTPRGEVDFISMEFIEGQTLAGRLRQSPVLKAEAAIIARQLCAGLAEAHRNNVVHGDLKSNNVILSKEFDGSLRAVIMDFGLARRPGGGGPLDSLALAGTPAYMAPELWKGEKPSVATDIYALGVMLWELHTGRKPTELGVTSSTLTWDERLVWKPPPGHGKWDRVIARCLDPDPARRFPSAIHVARALGPTHAKQWISAVAAGVILMSGPSVAVYLYTVAPKEIVSLAVLPFTSGGDGGSVADRLWRDSVTQISRLKGDADTKFSVAKTPEIASHLLRGTVKADHDKTTVHAYLIDAHSNVTTKEWSAEYGAGQTRYAGTALAAFLAEALKLAPVDAHPAVNERARSDYAAGLSNLRRDSTVDAALAAMKKAVTEDGDSALTWAGLAEAQWRKYFSTKDRAWLTQATESVRQAELRNPDIAAVHRISGLLQETEGRYEQAITEYRRAIELDPHSGDSYRRLGDAYEGNDQLTEALAAFQRAIELEPNYYRGQQSIGAFYFQRGAYWDAIDHFKKAVDLAPSEPNTHFALANAYLNRGIYAEAEHELRIAIGLNETPISLQTLGLDLMYQGRELEAINYLSRAAVLNPGLYLSWTHLGTCYRRIRHPAQAKRAYYKALETVEEEIKNNPRFGHARSFLAYICANLGDRHSAESEAAQALQLSPNDADTRYMAVLTYEILGRRDESLEVLSTSSQEVVADLSRWPDVADLHQDPRFMELMASYRSK